MSALNRGWFSRETVDYGGVDARNEQLTVIPAWNNTSAYSAAGTAGLTMPMYKRLSLSLGTVAIAVITPRANPGPADHFWPR